MSFVGGNYFFKTFQAQIPIVLRRIIGYSLNAIAAEAVVGIVRVEETNFSIGV